MGNEDTRRWRGVCDPRGAHARGGRAVLRAGPPGPLPVLGVANADMAGVGGEVQDLPVLPEKSGMDKGERLVKQKECLYLLRKLLQNGAAKMAKLRRVE